MSKEFSLPLTGNNFNFEQRVNRILGADRSLGNPDKSVNLSTVRQYLSEFKGYKKRMENLSKVDCNLPGAFTVMTFVASKILGDGLNFDAKGFVGCALIYQGLAEICDDCSDGGSMSFENVYNSKAVNGKKPSDYVERGMNFIEQSRFSSYERKSVISELNCAVSGYIKSEEELEKLSTRRGVSEVLANPSKYVSEILRMRNRGFGGLAVGMTKAVYGPLLPPFSEQRIRSAVLYSTLLDSRKDISEDRKNGDISAAELLGRVYKNLCRRENASLNLMLRAIGTDIGNESLRAFLDLGYRLALTKENLEAFFGKLRKLCQTT